MKRIVLPLLLAFATSCADESSVVGRVGLDAASDAQSELATLSDTSASTDRADVTTADAPDGAALDVMDSGGSDAQRTDVAGDTAPTDGARSDAADSATDAADVVDAGDPNEVLALAVDPPMATLRVTAPMTPVTQTFVARGRTRDGRTVPVTALWSVSRADVLTIASTGVATTTNMTGGDVVVTARYNSLAATANVRVVLDFGVTAPGAPSGVSGAFPTTAMLGTDAARAPAWVYPANETVFPQNVYKVLFQWRRGTANDRFRVTFESDRTHVTVYTDGNHATCMMAGTGLGCFEPTLDIWRYIAGSNPRGTVRVTVDGTTAASPGTYYRSSTLTIGFSRAPVPGAIYYWSTTVQGVRRATVGDAAPTNFLTPTEADRNCVACHTLSRRGNRMAADVGGNNLWVVEVSPTTPPPRIVTALMGRSIPMFWSTFSFDETRVVTAARGVMTLRRTADGTVINTVPLAMRTYGTQPDWAPDDSKMVFAQSASTSDRGVSAARIATIDILPSNGWGTPRMLYGTGMNNDTNQFPSFSWDSRWIAWTHSTGNGQNDPTSDLWLMHADGTAPRALTRANTVINNGTVTTPTIQDNMPTWAPSGVPDDYAWVAFSSTRDYGGVLSGASRLGRHEQLWVAAIDLTTPDGMDPSRPAFRLPFQGLAEDNHRPFWALDRVAAACTMAGGACMTSGDCCAPNVCRDGVCAMACGALDARCATSADCCAPGVCLSGTCRVACHPAGGTCASNSDCCAPTTCVSGTCTPGPCRNAGGACTSSADCCAPTSCVSGMCAAPTCHGTGAVCVVDGDCCAPNACRGGVCRPPCVAAGATCSTDGDCCAPNTCRGGVCRASCSTSGGACTTSADCCSPSTCVSGMCRPPCMSSGGACASDSDCCASTVCRAGMCATPCRATSDACTTNADCCSGTCTRGACAPPPCRPSGGSCSTDADCCSGTCVSGGCAPG